MSNRQQYTHELHTDFCACASHKVDGITMCIDSKVLLMNLSIVPGKHLAVCLQSPCDSTIMKEVRRKESEALNMQRPTMFVPDRDELDVGRNTK